MSLGVNLEILIEADLWQGSFTRVVLPEFDIMSPHPQDNICLVIWQIRSITSGKACDADEIYFPTGSTYVGEGKVNVYWHDK